MVSLHRSPSSTVKRHYNGQRVGTFCWSPERFPRPIYCSQLLGALWINWANIGVVSRLIKSHCEPSVCGLIPTMGYWFQSWSKSTARVLFFAQHLLWDVSTQKSEKPKIATRIQKTNVLFFWGFFVFWGQRGVVCFFVFSNNVYRNSDAHYNPRLGTAFLLLYVA